MSVVKRAASYNMATQAVLWTDSGPGTWTFTRTSTGIVDVVFPETFVDANSLMVMAHGIDVGVNAPQPANHIWTVNVTATGVQVRTANTSGTYVNTDFTIEVVGEIA
jgi:hypothetical protein